MSWKKETGTPKSLEGAIRNASKGMRIDLQKAHVKVIKAHVRDYLAQQFGTWMLSVDETGSSTLKKLFDKIVEDEKL